MSPRKQQHTGLLISYILDWLIIVATAAAGAGMNYIEPYHRAFSLLNLDISYPLVTESIATHTLLLVALVAPVVIIAIVALAFVPGRVVQRQRQLTRSDVLRLKLWELEKGWAGLGLSVAMAFFITQGAKNMFGKPRPDLLARCQPNLSDVASHVVGGFGQDVSERWTLVRSTICTQTDRAVLNDGFRSFPSGHSSLSWSGLLYLTLFLCSKFSIRVPYLPIQPTAADSLRPKSTDSVLPIHNNRESIEEEDKRSLSDLQTTAPPTNTAALKHPVSLRNLAASPPVYLIIPAFAPMAVALFISSTRYVEYYHFGFDIISGSLIGILTTWFSFRCYHLPLSRGQGWAWGARSSRRAFGISVGTAGYVGEDELKVVRALKLRDGDVEAATARRS